MIMVARAVQLGTQLFTKVEKFMGACKNRVTLKALANVSPGFALKPWAQKCPGDCLQP